MVGVGSSHFDPKGGLCFGTEGRGRLFGGKYLAGVCKIFPRRDLPLNRSQGHQLSTEGLLWVFPVHYQTPSLEKP